MWEYDIVISKTIFVMNAHPEMQNIKNLTGAWLFISRFYLKVCLLSPFQNCDKIA